MPGLYFLCVKSGEKQRNAPAGLSGAGVEWAHDKGVGAAAASGRADDYRLYGWYQGQRSKQTEERLARELAKWSILRPDLYAFDP